MGLRQRMINVIEKLLSVLRAEGEYKSADVIAEAEEVLVEAREIQRREDEAM